MSSWPKDGVLIAKKTDQWHRQNACQMWKHMHTSRFNRIGVKTEGMGWMGSFLIESQSSLRINEVYSWETKKLLPVPWLQALPRLPGVFTQAHSTEALPSCPTAREDGTWIGEICFFLSETQEGPFTSQGQAEYYVRQRFIFVQERRIWKVATEVELQGTF